MFLGIKSSSSSFALKTSKRGTKAKQNISSAPNRVIIGNKQRCLSCKGIMQLKNGKVSLKMFDINETYPHEEDCKMKGRF